jgi:hypothetical protein
MRQSRRRRAVPRGRAGVPARAAAMVPWIAVACRTTVIALALSAGIGAPSAVPTAASDPAPAATGVGPRERGILRFIVPLAQWPDVADLTAAPAAFDPPFDGNVRAFGYGLGLSYHHPVGHFAGGRLYLGGDAVGVINQAGKRSAGRWYGSGEVLQASIYAHSAYFTPSLRWVVSRHGRPTFRAGLGGGLYLVRFKDNIEGLIVETGQIDSAPGGFLALGARLSGVSGRLAIDCEVKVHGFTFDRLGSAFPGQRTGGPMWEVGLGVSRR